jgi:signal transduction histidine kinase
MQSSSTCCCRGATAGRQTPVLSRPSAPGGLGLGLAIVRAIAELHGGGAAIGSRVGEGTTIRITLPV